MTVEARERALPPVPRSWALTLAALLVARVLAVALPGMWLWGLNPPRFAHPVAAVLGLLIVAAALVPAFGGRLAPAAAWLGDRASRAPRLAAAAWAMVAMGIVWALPDRTHFTGDFYLRELAVRMAMNPVALFPQALPLDVWLHHTLPLRLAAATHASANDVARAIGMAEAAVLGLLAAELPRRLSLRGSASCLASAAVLFGAYLGTLTGYGKACSELTVLGVAFAVFGIDAVQRGRGLGLAGLAVACALLFHRSALLFLPALAGVCVLTWRAHPGAPRAQWWIGVGAPLLALAWLGARFVTIFLRYDRSAGYFGSPVGPWEMALNALDGINLLLLLAPLAILASGWRGRTTLPAALGVAFALPFLVLAASVRHSPQGLFRDWDMFAGVSAPLCVLAAARLGQLVASRGDRAPWIAPAALLSAIVPTLLWLGSQSEIGPGVRRVEAFASESPRRPEDVRARAWQFLCSRNSELGRYREAIAAAQVGVALAPTSSLLSDLAFCEQSLGQREAALADYRRVLVVNPGNPFATFHITELLTELGRLAEAERSLRDLAAAGAPREVVAYASQLVDQLRARPTRDSTLAEGK